MKIMHSIKAIGSWMSNILTLALFLTMTAGAWAQVQITVKEQGGVIPYAKVSLSFDQTGETVTMKTDRDGIAKFSGLPSGSYLMTVSYLGFADVIRPIQVSDETLSETIVMTLATFSETISVTTANRKEELLKEVAEPTFLIDAAAIEDLSATSAEDALIELSGSGLNIQSSGGLAHVSLNGVANNGVLILVDGRRYLGKNGFGDLDLADLNLSNIERIEVVKGAGSAIYGSEAMGGVVNFITKKPGSSKLSNSLSLRAGTYNDQNLDNTLTFRKGNTSGSLSVGARNYDGFDLDGDTTPETIGDPKSEDRKLSTNLETKVNDRFILRGLVSYSNRKILENITGGTGPFFPLKNNKQDRTQITVSPEADVLFGDAVLNLRYNYTKFERLDTDVFPDQEPVDAPPWLEWNNELNVTYKRPYAAFDNDHFFQVGYEFRNEKMDRAGIEIPDTGESKAERDIQVVWLSNEFAFGDSFKMTLGFRYDDYSDFGNEFSPKFSAIYSINDQNRLRGSYGHGFLAPRFGQLYYPITDFGFALLRGNPDLEPETSDSYSLGYSYSSEKVQASLDLFDTEIENGIGFDFSGNPWTYKNFDRYETKGFNLELAVNLPHGFTPSLSYTHKTAEGSEGSETPGVLKNAYFAKLVWANPRLGIRANIRAQIQDEADFTDYSRPAFEMFYAQYNHRLYSHGNHTINLMLQVKNLFDETDIFYRDENGVPIPNDFAIWQAPRTYYVGIKINSEVIGR